jgi:MFS family permease
MHLKSYVPAFIARYFRSKKLDEIYFSVFFKSLGESLISIFIPVYLIVLGYNLIDVGIYFAIFYCTFLIISPLGMFFNHRIGIKKTMAIGMAISLIYFYFLHLLSSGFSYYIAAIIYGISSGIYFAAFHVEFAKSTINKKEAENTSLLSVLTLIAESLGPLIGALFITQISFNFLFLISGAVFFISIIPLVFTKDFKISHEKLKLKEIATSDTDEKAWSYKATGVIYATLGIFWPLFIYLSVNNFISLGWIVSAASFFNILFLFFIGKISDKYPEKTLKAGVFTTAPIFILRLFFLSTTGLFITNLIGFASFYAIDIPFSKIIYRTAKKSKQICSYFLFRQLHMFAGRILVCLVIIFTASFKWLFILAALSTFIYLLLLREKNI